MAGIPTGTVTFLFTDIEGSTKLAREHAKTWEALQARHHSIMQSAIQSYNGYVFQIIGDAFCAAFHTAVDALHAATKSQIDLHSNDWDNAPVRVRMGIHTGKAEIGQSGQYRGYLAMSRVQRVMSAGHGGQVLISAATQELLLEDLPEDISLRDLGEHRLKDLVRPEHIYQLVSADLPVEFPPIKSLDAQPNNLPIQLTSFIGRESELKELKEFIGRKRFVTLTGVGGTGKTRLALQTAADIVDDFEDGVWLVELAPLYDPSLVPQTVASTLGLREQAGRDFLEVLKDYLSRKNLLVVLDNCEHLIEACAQLADALLHAAPQLKILATSREALGIAGESTYPVHSFALPDIHQASLDILGQFDAVRLFIDRALAMQPNFQVTKQNAPAVAQICTRLDGIPLAIELAAARVKGLSVEQIASRLNDRFRLLTGGSRTALPRHRTLQATIDWSYKLLSQEERTLMCRLSVFAGGWTLEAAEHICASGELESDQILDLLLRLIDKSLVIAETDLSEPRYNMLETIRQYAQEKLDEAVESNSARDRHLDYFRNLAEQADPHLRSSGQLVWLYRIETELDNIRAALRWAQEGGSVESGLQLATELLTFWVFRAYFLESSLVFKDLLAKTLPNDHVQLLAKAHLAVGWLESFLGNVNSAHAYARKSEQFSQQLGPTGKGNLAAARNLLYDIEYSSKHDPIQACQSYEANLELSREAGDTHQMARSLVGIGEALKRSGDWMGARRAQEQAMELFRKRGDNVRAAQINGQLACIAIQEGKYEEARTRCEEILSFYRQMPVILGVDIPMWLLGAIALRDGDCVGARVWYTECLLFEHQTHQYSLLAECLIGFAGIATVEKRFERAARLVGAAEVRRAGLENFDQEDLQRLIAVLREELGAEDFNALSEKGSTMMENQTVEFVLEEIHV